MTVDLGLVPRCGAVERRRPGPRRPPRACGRAREPRRGHPRRIARRRPDGPGPGWPRGCGHARTRRRRSTTSCRPSGRSGPIRTPHADYDLIVISDCGSLDRVGSVGVRHADLFGRVSTVVIDHHASNSTTGEAHWIDAHAAATCEMVALLAGRLGLPLDLDDGALATELMGGIVMDTATFAHPNATPRTLAVSAALVEVGAPLSDISRRIYRSKPDAAAAPVRARPGSARDRGGGADHLVHPARRGPGGHRHGAGPLGGHHRPAGPGRGGRGGDHVQGGLRAARG